MTQGIRAFKNGEFAAAVDRFKTTLAADPVCTTAHLYLATAYMQQFIPGADSLDNLAMASAATEQFDIVLQQEPDNRLALASEASLYFNQKKLDEAATWYKKLIAVAPQSHEAFYTLGVIAWTRVQEPIQKARQDSGMKLEDPGPIRDAAVRGALRTNYMPVIEEGMDSLHEALAMNPEYTDAMAYMNLLYREKADLEESPRTYAEDMAQADRWFQKTIDTRIAVASGKPGSPLQ